MQFSVAKLPRVELGAGKIRQLPRLISQYGRRVLFVTGSGSLLQTPPWQGLVKALQADNIDYQLVQVNGEPSPQLVDEAVSEFAPASIDVVVGFGGGSALDAAKAIAGLLKVQNSVMDYLEGVGPELSYEGPAVPFIAVPTTAGTGSEATKNAVLSVHGREGFKKSFRDDKLVAEYAILDPDLLASCPAELIAANGMDAITQLMESYTSLKANPFTDALAESGLRLAKDALFAWYEQGPRATEAQAHMAYAAWLSGITLAQVGLGSVHGLASPLGAFFPIPHGVVCGTLLAEATAVNIQAMQGREPDNPALARYAKMAQWFYGKHQRKQDKALEMLVERLKQWTDRLQLPRLSNYGIKEEDFDHIIAHCRGSSMKTNPIVLSDEEVGTILQRRL